MRPLRVVLLWALALLPVSLLAEPQEVLVLLSSDTEIYAAGLNGIQSVLDRPIRIQYLDTLAADDAGQRQYFRSLETSGQVAMIIAIGTRAARASLRHVSKLPVLFSMVSAPRTLGPGVSRRCGVTMDVPVERFFETLKEIRPGALNVAAFYSTSQGEYLAGEGEYSDLRNGVFFQKVRVAQRSQLKQALEKLTGKVDALYLVADPLYDRARFRQISEFSRKNGYVLMTSFASLVQAGATFALTPDYFRLGVLTGEMARRILQGKSTCPEEAVQYSDRVSLYINEKYAKNSGIEIPDSVRRRASLTQLINAGIRLFNQGRLRSAKRVFDVVLQRDPRNKAAFNYRARIVERETREETARLLKEAGDAVVAERYAEALRAYSRILEVNPDHRTAQELLRQTRERKSESERLAAAKAAERGDVFRALRLYRDAVDTMPQNKQALKEMRQLRSTQGRRVPGLYAEGLEAYNKRRYAEAIRAFGNVLLLAPGHKQAPEYLRLSKKKKLAVERLLRRQGRRRP